MKNSEPTGNDEKLSKLLHEWKSDVALPPRFQDGVWRQIENATALCAKRPSALDVFAHWIGTLLPRPAMATAYVAVLLTVGATAGWAQAHQTNARVKDELGDRYVRVLDPYQAPRN